MLAHSRTRAIAKSRRENEPAHIDSLLDNTIALDNANLALIFVHLDAYVTIHGWPPLA